jgi:hypothetical protein
MYHIFFSHCGYVYWIHNLNLVNSATVNVGKQIPLRHFSFKSFGKCSEAGLLGQMVILILVFKGTSILFLMSPLHFWFHLTFFFSLAKNVYLFICKSKLLVLLNFCIVFLVSISLTSVLIFIVSFFLLMFGLVYYYFYISLRYNVKLFWDLSSFSI